MRKILLACLFVLSGTMAFAQFASSKSSSASTTEGWSGLRVSYGFNTSSFKEELKVYTEPLNATTSSSTSELTVAWSKGLPLMSNVPLILEIAPEVSYVMGDVKSKWKDLDVEYDASYNQASVNIPVNIGYLIHIGDGISLFPYAGLKGKVNVVEQLKMKANNKMGIKEKTYNLMSDKDLWLVDGQKFKDKPGNLLQLGAQIGCGVNVQKFHVGLSYNFDLTDAVNGEMNTSELKYSTSLKNSSVRLTVGYNF